MSKAAVPEWDVSPRPVGIVELPVGDRCRFFPSPPIAKFLKSDRSWFRYGCP